MKNDSSAKFKKIASYAFRPEAEAMAEILKRNNIPVLIQSEASGLFGSSGGVSPAGIFLLVPEKDIEMALKILPSQD